MHTRSTRQSEQDEAWGRQGQHTKGQRLARPQMKEGAAKLMEVEVVLEQEQGLELEQEQGLMRIVEREMGGV